MILLPLLGSLRLCGTPPLLPRCQGPRLAADSPESMPSRELLMDENRLLRERLRAAEARLEGMAATGAESSPAVFEPIDESAEGRGFWDAFRARGTWLCCLLLFQSTSSFVLASNEARASTHPHACPRAPTSARADAPLAARQELISSHPTVLFFLTMLVGAGGNAGNQSAVRIIRGLATGEVRARAAAETPPRRHRTPSALTLRR